MGTMYGSQFEDVSDFLLVSDPGHEDRCGHEAIEHGDHVDYLHDSHRHFLRGAKWFHHASQKD